MNKKYLYLLMMASFNVLSAGEYIETAKKNTPSSWMTKEFNAMWGLESIGAHYAYARGYNGENINIGIFDDAVFVHPEFNFKLNKLDSDQPYDFENGVFADHGTHVAGIAAASRDGKEMHGVAYKAGLVSTKILETDDNHFEKLIRDNTRIFNNSWGPDPEIMKDENGRDIRLPDGRPFFETVTKQDALSGFLTEKIKELSEEPIPSSGLNDDLIHSALVRAARFEKLIIFAAGNSNSYNVPIGESAIPTLIPEVLSNFIVVVNVDKDSILDPSSTMCGYTASYCIAAPGQEIYSTRANGEEIDEDNITPTYGVLSGTSMSAPMVSGAAAVLMQRFPYMTASQISSVLLTTSTDLGANGIDSLYGWGKLNLKDAIDGPKMFITADDIPTEFYVEGSYEQTQFVANIPGIGAIIEPESGNQRVCNGIECAYDIWANDINGHGGLTKVGNGSLVLTGNNTYIGPTKINQGALVVNGSILSDVSVQDGSTIAGIGSIGSLVNYKGGIVAPGYMGNVGSLNVTGNVNLKLGGLYLIDIDESGKSSKIQSNGHVSIEGSDIAVSLPIHENLLSKREVNSLLGQQFNILSGVQGVVGQFGSVKSNFLFLDMVLDYQSNKVMLDMKRNNRSLINVAKTQNERSLASALNTLPIGSPIYESIIRASSESDVRQAYQQLSGQIHSDISSSLIQDSRQLRETLNGRLRQMSGASNVSDIKTNNNSAWAHLFGTWDHASGNLNSTGYKSTNYGVLLGIDSEIYDDWQFGSAVGYSKTALNGGYGSNANSNNYQLALYGGKRLDNLALRFGIGNTWHSIDTSRTISYGSNFDHQASKYNGQTAQIFTEVGYNLNTGWSNIEPFVNLAYINFKNDGIAEKGGATSLRGDKQHTESQVLTLGLRADSQWRVNNSTEIGVSSELGWHHQLGDLKRASGLNFSGNDTLFIVNSVPVSRNAAIVKLEANAFVNKNIKFSLGYSGALSENYQDNSITAGFTWNF
ncbi:autotransporter domain-containing protein [Providencia rettgeri]